MDRSALQASLQKPDVRQLIKFHVLLRKSPSETHSLLKEGLEDFCPSYETVRKWHNLFSNGTIDERDAPRSGRPKTASDEDHVERVRDLVEKDRRLTCEEIASEIGISSFSVHAILRNHLHKRKIAAKWVPHVLNEEQRGNRVRICASHARRFRRERNSFLHRIVAGDETWARAFEPELKRQSAEWTGEGSPRPTKAVRSPTPTKVMHIVFFDVHGLLVDHSVPPGVTVNGEYYASFIRNHLRPAIRRKRPNLLRDGPIILHDNAAPHTKRDVIQLLTKEYDWEILEHPPYSPDLSPCDFFWFPRVKVNLRGKRFKTFEEINSVFHRECVALDRHGSEDGINGLVRRWNKCIESNGEYFE